MLGELNERNGPLVDRLAWFKVNERERMPKREVLIQFSLDAVDRIRRGPVKTFQIVMAAEGSGR
jgi:hypothetical protein